MNTQAQSLFDASVLIAVKNEAQHLGKTLLELSQQLDSDLSVEVIVIDGQSTDETIRIAQSFASKLPGLRVLHNPKRLAAAGWNIGIANSKAPVVMILSGHAKLPADFFHQILPKLTPSICGVGGIALPVGTDNRSALIAAAFSSRLGHGGASFMAASEPLEVETIAFGCYWREALIEVGGFDETIVRGQDWDLNLRLRQSGKALWLFPSVKIEYATRSDFSSLWRRQYLAGYWKPYIHLKNTAPFLLRHCIPSLFVGCIVLLAMLGFTWKPAWFTLVSVLALHGVASLTVSSRLKLSLMERLEFWWATWIIHFAYGLGFWTGFAQGLVRVLRR